MSPLISHQISHQVSHEMFFTYGQFFESDFACTLCIQMSIEINLASKLLLSHNKGHVKHLNCNALRTREMLGISNVHFPKITFNVFVCDSENYMEILLEDLISVTQKNVFGIYFAIISSWSVNLDHKTPHVILRLPLSNTLHALESFLGTPEGAVAIEAYSTVGEPAQARTFFLLRLGMLTIPNISQVSNAFRLDSGKIQLRWHLCRTKLPRKVLKSRTKSETKSSKNDPIKTPIQLPKNLPSVVFTVLTPNFKHNSKTSFTARICRATLRINTSNICIA